MLKKVIKICVFLDSKNKILLLSQCSSLCSSFYFHHTTPTCLFGAFKIKSLCNVNLTVDVTPFSELFILIFQVCLRSFQYDLAVRRNLYTYLFPILLQNKQKPIRNSCRSNFWSAPC